MRPFDRRPTSRRVLLAAAAVGGLACQRLTGPDDIIYGALPAVIDPAFGVGIGTVLVADSVALGAPLAVIVPTQGGGCTRKGETRVRRVGPLEAEVLPYDSVPVRLPPNVGCTDDLRVLDHAAVLRFGQRGTATVRVRGRGAADPPRPQREIVVERRVRVY